jgi:hypothetical protein
VRAEGLRYERKFGKHLHRVANRLVPRPEILHGQWIQFEDLGGPGCAQPDHLIKTEEAVWIFENKLSYREEGWWQLTGLYSPLVKAIWDLPQILVQVVRNLGGSPRHDSSVYEGAWAVAELPAILGCGTEASLGDPPRFLLHWLGIVGA